MPGEIGLRLGMCHLHIVIVWGLVMMVMVMMITFGVVVVVVDNQEASSVNNDGNYMTVGLLGDVEGDEVSG